MRITTVQFAPVRGDVAGNIATLDRMIDGVRTDLLVLPELASTGYFFTDRRELLNLVDTSDRDLFIAWSRKAALAVGGMVVAGVVERTAGDRLFNSAAIALPDGGLHIYRKAHLFYKESMVFDRGDSGFFVVEWEGARIGVMICYDWRFPEAARTLALAGADVIAHPSNLVAAPALWGPVMSTRAFENRVICATANRCGAETLAGEVLEFTGESRIIGSNGDLLAMSAPDGESILEVEVDHLATRRKSFNPFNDIFGDRRPDLYRLTGVVSTDGG